MFRRMFRPPFHEGTNRGRCGVQHRHAVAFADVPEAVALGPVGRPFVHHHRGTVGERTVYDIRMARHPADIGGAPEDVVVAQVEDVLRRRRHLGEVATGGVHDPLRFPGRARRVQNEQQVLCFHPFGLAMRRLGVERAVPPVIAAVRHRAVRRIERPATTMNHQATGDRRALGERVVHEALERQRLAAPISAVGGDATDRLGVVDPVAQ